MRIMSDIIASVGSAIFGHSFGRRLERRRLRSGRYRCALRLIDGNQPGIDQRWLIEKALISAGTLSVRGRTIEVRDVSSSYREPTTREQWSSLGTEFIIFRISTSQARIELGVVRGQEREVFDRLQVPEL